MPEKLYRCGDCPVCSFLGDLVLVEAVGSGDLFVLCPSCGCAFDAPTDRVEAIVGPDRYAVEGFVLPRRDGVQVAIDRGWRPRFLAVLEAERTERLGPGFSPRSLDAEAGPS